jgi:hypothetical protein
MDQRSGYEARHRDVHQSGTDVERGELIRSQPKSQPSVLAAKLTFFVSRSCSLSRIGSQMPKHPLSMRFLHAGFRMRPLHAQSPPLNCQAHIS